MSNCYLCGAFPAPHKLSLKKTFTAHSSAAYPDSNHLCDRCEFALNTRAYYWNEAKGKYSVLYARNWSWLYQGDKLLSPVFDGEHKGFPVVKNLATRAEMREWLLNPPEPPFTMAIAESGQKHILFMAKEAHSRDFFPVQFELDSLLVRRDVFRNSLDLFESLMGLGATKAEILSGQYKPSFLLKAILVAEFNEWEEQIAKFRGSRYLSLVSHVAIKRQIDGGTKNTNTASPKTQVQAQGSKIKKLESRRQMSIFDCL